MQKRLITLGAAACAVLFLLSTFLLMGNQHFADASDGSGEATLQLTDFGFAPLIMSDKVRWKPTETVPAPSRTPYGTATATPAGSATATVTATSVLPSPTTGPVVSPTPGMTATATRIPDTLPTPVQNPLRVLDNHTVWIDDLGRLNVLGEVENTGSMPVRSVRIVTQFHNKKGRVIQSVEALTMLNHLGPGEKACFAVSLDPPDKWRTYSIGETSFQLDTAPIDGLQLSNVVGGLDDLLGWYVVSGEVTNASTRDYGLLRLVATVYDTDGHVLGCDFAYTFNTDLPRNESDGFEVLFADRDYSAAVDIRVQAEGESR